MKLFQSLFGKSIPVHKHEQGFISFGDGKHRIELGPRLISLSFEDGESPADTGTKMVQRLKESGTGLKYLEDMKDVYGNPIETGVRLFFYQWKKPFVWKFYQDVGNGFEKTDEADSSEQDAIKWALKKIKEQ